MSSLTLLGDTSGSVVLDAPAIAGSSTITLPTTGGTMRTTTTPGTILQVVNATYTTQLSTSSSSFVTTNLTVNITPASSSNKMLIMYTLGDVGTTNPNSGVSVALFKNGSQVGSQLYSRLSYVDTSATETQVIGLGPGHYYDSPATTSTLTYAIYFNNAGGGTATVFRDNTYGSITVMEIAG